MQFGRIALDTEEVEIRPRVNDSFPVSVPGLSTSAIVVPPTGTVSSTSTGPGIDHLNATAFGPTGAALADPSLNTTAVQTAITTSSLTSTTPSLTTVQSPPSTAASQSSTFAASSSTSVAPHSSPSPPALKEPAAFATPSSSSGMAVSSTSSSHSASSHASQTSTSKAPSSSTSASPAKPSRPAPAPPKSVTSSTHSSAESLTTQRAEPSLTPSSRPSASSSPAGAPVTDTPSQVHTTSSTPVPGTTSDFVSTSVNDSQQSSTVHTSPSSNSTSKSATASHETTTNNLKGNSISSAAHPSSSAIDAGNGHSVASNPSSIISVPSSSIAAAPSGATIHSSEAISNWDFFDNKKAVAGVFVVVGLALLAIVVASVFCCRRMRARRQRRSVAFQTISQPITTYQATGSLHEGLIIDAERESSHRRLVSPSLKGSDVASVHRSASQSSHFSGDAHSPATPGRAGIGALGLTGMRTHMDSLPMGRQMTQIHRYDGPFSDYHRIPPPPTYTTARPFFPPPDVSTIGIAISGGPESTPDVNKSRFSDDRAPSPTPSTPSIYPPSLPAQQDPDDFHFYEKEMRRPPADLTRPLKVPQRVHFNELRRNVSASDPFADPDPDSVDDLFYLETQAKVHPPKIDTRQLFHPGPSTPPDSTIGDSSATTPSTTQSSDGDHDAKFNPFAATFLGRSVVGKIEPWARPPRSPLRNASVSSRAGK